MAARKKAAARKTGSGKKKTTRKQATRKAAAKKKATRRKSKASSGAKRPAGKGGAKQAGKASAYPEVEGLVELMDRHGLVEVDYKAGPGGIKEIRLSRAAPLAGAAPVAAVSAHAPAAAVPAPAAETPADAGSDDGLVPFASPMVGTFYRAPSPEASPFVSVGDTIDGSSTVCIIEAMKVMNEITPDVSGEVVSIEVENGEAVEFGQTLFLVRPR